MRWVKLIAVLVILGLIALFAWQNIPTFNAVQSFQLNLYFGQPLVWTHSVIVLMAISAGIGLVLGLLVMLKPFVSTRRKLAQERQERQELQEKREPVQPQEEEPPPG
jgi:uncharacterized integral membrane protein